MDLDKIYGPCREPGSAIQPHELRVRPLTRMELTADTGPVIARYLDRSPGLLTSIFCTAYHLLWVMDDHPRVFIAVEELLDATDKHIGALPLAEQARPSGVIKLGHPSLVDGDTRNARIGGEIIYDPDWEEGPDWVLTNKSGRYGLRKWQTEGNLREVHGFFEAKGLYLGLRFIRPRP